jgi:uncharacterized protein YndB with AHSA1/START domain
VSDDAIVHEVLYPHPIERVWRALTDSAALATWLMPNDFEPRVGHRFSFRVEREQAQSWSGVVECEVREVEAPRRVSYTWRSGDVLPETLVTFTLAAEAGGTRLRLEHSGFAAGGRPALTIRDILAQGWGSNLLRGRLPALLERMQAEGTASTTGGTR